MIHIMFDVDGTLVESYDFDELCFLQAVKEVTGLNINNNWESYPHVTDRGILQTFAQTQAKDYSLAELEKTIKPVFIQNIKQHLALNPAKEVKGALKFFEYLKSRDDVFLSIATGGWEQTAKAKLESAGFDISGIKMASSDDHHERIKIMEIAAQENKKLALTYFGDALWDVKACAQLGVNLVIVGQRVKHHQQIEDFLEFDEVMKFVLGEAE